MNLTASLNRVIRRADRMKQQATKSLLQTLKKIDRERKERVKDLDAAAHQIGQQLAALGWNGRAKPTKATRATRTARKGKRTRRSADQLKTEATKVVAFIRSSGKDGIGGAEIRKKFPGVGQNIKGFVQQYTGQRLRTQGRKAAMKYLP